MTGPDALTVADDATRRELADLYTRTLLDDVVPFWLRHGLDREHGGIMTCLDADGTIVDTDKGMWQQGRFAWLMGELCYAVGAREPWLDACRSTIEFIDRFGFDPADGRMWFHLTRDGRPIRKRRYAFTESFAAIAYGGYARAIGSDRYAERAAHCLDVFVNHVPPPKFEPTRPTRSIGPPMIALVTAQELRSSIGLDGADAIIDRALETIVRYHVKQDLCCVVETVGADGALLDHFDGRTLNPGHAIEAAWFIMREGARRDDRGLIDTGCRMLDWMWERGWDREHGGILYFVDLHGGPVAEYWHDMKFWWPQNETIIATLYAWRLTGDPKYARMHRLIHDWAFARFPDRAHGEWFGYLRRDGAVSSTLKGNLWKGPFHLPRMLMECSALLADG